MKKNGFTLIELLVTIIIIIIMASIILPSVDRCKESARRVVCSSNLKQIGNSLLVYAGDWNGYFPPRTTYVRDQLSNSGNFLQALGILYNDLKYIDNPDLFFCPSEPERKKGSEFPHASTVHGHTANNHYGNYFYLAWDQETIDGSPVYRRNTAIKDPIRAICADLHITYSNSSLGTRKGKVHKGEGHNILYLDGHIRWLPINKTESNLQPNVDFGKIDE